MRYSLMPAGVYYPDRNVCIDAGRGLQPRPKRLHASITFETLIVKNGVTNPVPLRRFIEATC